MTTRTLRVMVVDQAAGVWGAQRYLLRLAPLLQRHGVELTLACPCTLEVHVAWREAGLPAVELDVPSQRNIRGATGPAMRLVVREVRRSALLTRRIAAEARAGKYDAIWSNAHWTHLESGLAGRASRIPVVLHLHEESVPGLGAWLRALAVQLATSTIAVSRAVADGLPRVIRPTVRVIPNGVDTDELSPADEAVNGSVRAALNVGPNEVMLLAATRIDPAKRIEDLIALIHRLADPVVKLVVAGKTSGFREYEREVRALADGLPPGSVTFCGNRSDMPALFAASDVVVHTGTVEGMPLTVIEAQSCGKPVVAYDVAGVAEAVVNGATGFLVAPGDVDELLERTRRLVNESALRTDMGSAGRQHVLAHHRIDVQAERIAAMLHELRWNDFRAG